MFFFSPVIFALPPTLAHALSDDKCCQMASGKGGELAGKGGNKVGVKETIDFIFSYKHDFGELHSCEKMFSVLSIALMFLTKCNENT